MKIKVSCLIFALLMIAGAAHALDRAARVAILPFQIHSSQDLGFLRDGIQDMLESRLSWENKVTVIDKETVNNAYAKNAAFKGKNQALMVGANVRADYVVYGSLTVIGDSASIDAKVVNIEGQDEPVSFFKQADTVGGVIPQINQFASDINTQVFKRPKAPSFDGPAPEETGPRYTSPNQGFILPSQQLAIAPGAQAGTFWRTPDMDDLIVGMAFGDVNNDGNKELVYITDNEVRIARFGSGRLEQLAVAAKTRVNRFVGVDIGDINNNGVSEIFVSALAEEETAVSSFVIEYDGSGYKEIVNRSPYLFRVTKNDMDQPLLLGQKPENKKGGLFGAPIYKMQSTGSEYIAGDILLKKKMANVLGTAHGKIGVDDETITVAFDNKDYIRLFNGPGRPTWTGVEKLGGNMSRYLLIPAMPDDDPETEYFPTRIRLFDTDQDGKKEVITSVNHDRAMNLVQGFRSFSKARMQALTWDSLGLQAVWESRHLSGRISDFFLADVDGDGVVELVISLVKKEEGAVINTSALSMIVAFDLNPVKE